MIPNLRALYGIRPLSTTLTYMLQSTEYDLSAYLRWFWRTNDFSQVMYRRTLELTKASRLLRLCLMCGVLLQIAAGLLFLALWHWRGFAGGGLFGLALLLSYPAVWAHAVVVPLWVGRELFIKPRQAREVSAASEIFANHPGIKIAIAGSYGKTSMKELLATVLSESKRVAATPANKNVAVSHARFARQLNGEEEILLVEYGEGKPGDVRHFAETTHPTHGIITGLAPAHLDQYKTLQAAGEDIFSLADYLHGRHVYVNDEPRAADSFLKDSYERYDAAQALGWKVSGVQLSLDGTKFTLAKGKQKIALHSGLLGRHNIGPLALAATLGMELDLTAQEVQMGIAKTVPYEHRMQPYKLGGAWIIDDTYNGNLEGVRAGTDLLADLPAKRKLYVTPGLVEQGADARAVHAEMGRLIAGARPDIVVVMKNSAAGFIQAGLQSAGFAGEVRVENDPLAFYQNLGQFVAAGDLVLMQNDWTDNYQ